MSASRLLSQFVPLAVLTLVFATATTVMACPSCKEALASIDGDQANLVNGFFWSILFMMSMPFILLGTFGLCMYRAVNKARAQQEAEQAAVAPAEQPERELVDV